MGSWEVGDWAGGMGKKRARGGSSRAGKSESAFQRRDSGPRLRNKKQKKEEKEKEKKDKKKDKKQAIKSGKESDKEQPKRASSTRELKSKESSSDKAATRKTNLEKKLLAQVNNFVVEEPFVAPLFLKFVRSNQAEEMAHELVNMFYAKHKHTECIVEDAIFYVAQEYPNGNELLRSTNIFVAVLSECARLGGHRYLTRVLGTQVKIICGQNNDGETDSLQLWTNDHSKNTVVIVEYATSIMDKILASAPILPMFLKQMMIALHKSMSRNKANPVSGSMLISAFLFLRFLCPALVSPHCYGLIKDPPTITAQRMLVSIAKMLQAVVNSKIDLAKATATPSSTQQSDLAPPKKRATSFSEGVTQKHSTVNTHSPLNNNTTNNNTTISPTAPIYSTPGGSSSTDEGNSSSDSENTNSHKSRSSRKKDGTNNNNSAAAIIENNHGGDTSTNLANSNNNNATDNDSSSDHEQTITPSPAFNAQPLSSLTTSSEPHEATETDHEIAVGEFIKKYSPLVEVYATAVLDKRGECDGKRFYKVTQQKEYGKMALEWMQDNKEILIEYLMRNKQIRDKLAFEQFLSKASHGELDGGHHRSPRLFKGPMGLGRRKKEGVEMKEDEDYEKVRLTHKRELRKTKRKEEEKQLARKKEKEGGVATGSNESVPTLSKSGSNTPATGSPTNSPGPSPAAKGGVTMLSRGGSRQLVSSSPELLAHQKGRALSVGDKEDRIAIEASLRRAGQFSGNSSGSGGSGGIVVPVERNRSDSWVFLTDESSGADDDEASDVDSLVTTEEGTESISEDHPAPPVPTPTTTGASRRYGSSSGAGPTRT